MHFGQVRLQTQFFVSQVNEDVVLLRLRLFIKHHHLMSALFSLQAGHLPMQTLADGFCEPTKVELRPKTDFGTVLVGSWLEVPWLE